MAWTQDLGLSPHPHCWQDSYVLSRIFFHCDQGSLVHADVAGLVIHLANLRVGDWQSIWRYKARSPPCVNANLLDKSQVNHGHEVWAPRCKRRRRADPRRKGWATFTIRSFLVICYSSIFILTLRFA
jgi:hypothetical protein